MIKKFSFLFLLIISLSLIVGCDNTTEENDEIITASGLDEAQIYIGETFDFMEGVTFTSNTRGDITSSVNILETVDTNNLGVSIIFYETHYENDEIFQETRRIVVLNPPLNETNNLIINGDFSDSINHYGISKHNDYPDDIQFIIDPDLLRLQIIINSTSDNTCWPNISQLPISLNSENSYEFSILVSGTESTYFTVDIVETNNLLEVINVIEEPHTVQVGLNSEGMQEVTFNFTPLISSDNARLRLMFGGNGNTSPQGTIYIDNIQLKIED